MLSNTLSIGAAVTGIALVSAACTDTAANTGTTRLDDAAMTCAPPAVEYRLTSVDPSVRAARTLDLDSNGTLDDALGAAYDTLAVIEPSFAMSPRFDARLAADVPWLVAVDRCGEDVRFTIARGFSLDGAPPQVERNLPRAVGAPDAGAIVARDGEAEVPLVALADPLGTSGIGWIRADGVVVSAVVTDDAIEGVFVAALDVTDARAQLAPPLAAFLDALPPADPLRTAAVAADAGSVTAAAVADSALFRELVTGDVTVRAPDGTPRGDGTQRVSIAFAFHGVRAR
jgi:hypothetical protein